MAAFILIFLKEWIFTQRKMCVDSFLSVFLHMHFPFTKIKIPKTFFPPQKRKPCYAPVKLLQVKNMRLHCTITALLTTQLFNQKS